MASTRHGNILATLAWNLQPLLGSPIRIEENTNGCVFVVRAEVPGIEPKDISVMMADGELKIEVDRLERHPDCWLSEFRYGRFARTLRLPRGARADEVTAVCGGGILEITIGLDPPAPIGRTVRVVAGNDALPPDPVLPPVRQRTRPAGRNASTTARKALGRSR
jgi:HSP20 family molecular chaperone IbpA